MAMLCKKWIEDQDEFCTTSLPTPPISFRTQFRTGRARRADLRRGLTGAELAENETQDVIVVRGTRPS